MTTPAGPDRSTPSSASPFPAASAHDSREWSIREALDHGVEALRRHWQVLVPAAFLMTFLNEGIGWAMKGAGAQLGGAEEVSLGMASSGISVLLAMVLSAGFLRITLDSAQGRTPSMRSFMTNAGSALPLLATYVLSALLITLGIMALIVPGLMLAVGLSFAPLLVIDRKLEATDAMRQSWELLDGSKMRLVGFSLVCGLLALALSIPAGLVAFATDGWPGSLLLALPVLAISAIAGVGQSWIYLRLLGPQPR